MTWVNPPQRTNQFSPSAGSVPKLAADSVSTLNYAQLVKSGAGKLNFGRAKLKDWTLAVALTVFFPAGMVYVVVRFFYCKYTGKPVTIFWICMRATLATSRTRLISPVTLPEAGGVQTGLSPQEKPLEAGDSVPARPSQKSDISPKKNSTDEDEKLASPDPEPQPSSGPCLDPVIERNPPLKPGLHPTLDPSPQPERDLPTLEEVQKASKKLYDSLPTGGRRGIFAKPGKPFDPDAAKEAFRVLLPHGVKLPSHVQGIPALINWIQDYLQCFLGSSDPELRKLAYDHLAKCKPGTKFWFNGGAVVRFAESLPDGPAKDDLREFFLRNSDLVRQMLAHDLAHAARIFAAVNGLSAILESDDSENLLYALQFPIPNDIIGDIFGGDSLSELRRCLENIIRNSLLRPKFLGALAPNLHPQHEPTEHTQNVLLSLGEGAFPDFCHDDPDAFVKFVVFSPNPFVRKAGMKIAIQNGLDIARYIRENTPLLIEQVLAMGKPFLSDGYRLLKEYNLENLLLGHASDAFVKLVLKSPKVEIATSGLSFIIGNGLFRDLIRAQGPEIIKFTLDPRCDPRVRILLVQFLQSVEIQHILRDTYADLFDELWNEMLLGKFSRVQLRMLMSLAAVFEKEHVVEKAKAELQGLLPLYLTPTSDVAVSPSKVFRASGNGLPGDFLADQMYGRILTEYVGFPTFQLLQDCRNLSDSMDGPDTCEQIKDQLQHLLAERQAELATTRTDFSPEQIARNLGSTDPKVRQDGYRYLDGIQNKQDLIRTLEPMLPWACLVSLPLFNASVRASPSQFFPYPSMEECVAVLADFLKFCEGKHILPDIMSLTNVDIPLSMALLASPDVTQRKKGYNFIAQQRVNLADFRNFQLFVALVLNSDDEKIREAGVNFLKTEGFEFVEINGETYKLEVYFKEKLLWTHLWRC